MGSAPLTAIAGAEPKGNAAESSTGCRGLGRVFCILIIVRFTYRGGGPVPASTILLIEADPASGELISSVLAKVGYTVTTIADADEAFARVAEHQLAILDVVTGLKTAFDICREIRGTPALARIPVLCVGQSDDVEDRIRFLEAGADDVMAKPFDARELEARVEALLLRFQRSKDMTVVSSDGLTVSRAAANRRRSQPAGRRRHDDDRDEHRDGRWPASGRIGSSSSTSTSSSARWRPTSTSRSSSRSPTSLVTTRRCASRSCSGRTPPATTAGSTSWRPRSRPSSPSSSRPNTSDRILTTLLESYDSVVIDAGSWLDERTMTVFEHAETVIFPVCPEIGALKALHGLLDYLNEAGSVSAKSTFVLNNQFAREILKLRDVESALGTRVASELPYDPFLYLKAVNEGVPIVIGAPRSLPAEKFEKLAATAFGLDGISRPGGAGAQARGSIRGPHPALTGAFPGGQVQRAAYKAIQKAA